LVHTASAAYGRSGFYKRTGSNSLYTALGIGRLVSRRRDGVLQRACKREILGGISQVYHLLISAQLQPVQAVPHEPWGDES
jgi:hypothetical protein